MSRISFVADVQPLGTNHAYAPARWGKRHGFVKTGEAQAYQARIRLACAHAIFIPFVGPVAVSLLFAWPTERGDVDSAIKLTLDALQGAAVENDRQVKRLHVERITDRKRPRVEVEVEEIATVAQQTPADFKAVLGPKPLAKLNRRRLQSSVRRPT